MFCFFTYFDVIFVLLNVIHKDGKHSLHIIFSILSTESISIEYTVSKRPLFNFKTRSAKGFYGINLSMSRIITLQNLAHNFSSFDKYQRVSDLIWYLVLIGFVRSGSYYCPVLICSVHAQVTNNNETQNTERYLWKSFYEF